MECLLANLPPSLAKRPGTLDAAASLSRLKNHPMIQSVLSLTCCGSEMRRTSCPHLASAWKIACIYLLADFLELLSPSIHTVTPTARRENLVRSLNELTVPLNSYRSRNLHSACSAKFVCLLVTSCPLSLPFALFALRTRALQPSRIAAICLGCTRASLGL